MTVSLQQLTLGLIPGPQNRRALGPIKPTAPLARDPFVPQPLLSQISHCEASAAGTGTTPGGGPSAHKQSIIPSPSAQAPPVAQPRMQAAATCHARPHPSDPMASNVFLSRLPGNSHHTGFPRLAPAASPLGLGSPACVTQKLTQRRSDCREQCVFFPASVFCFLRGPGPAS